MPLQPSASIQNSFIGGLKTEFTGLNFPKNAATDCDNAIFDIVGDVTRRLGVDVEANFTTLADNRTGEAISSYVWTNVGGDGSTKFLVRQIGATLYFYNISAVTSASSLSAQKIATTINIATFVPSGSTFNPATLECEYADGNGYLFVYNAYTDPIYVSYTGGTVAANVINIQTRDFTGFPEPGVPITTRPPALTVEHNYNLQNQGWTQGTSWSFTTLASQYPGGAGPSFSTGSKTWIAPAGLTGVTVGQTVIGVWGSVDYGTAPIIRGVVTAYSGTSMTVNVNTILWFPAAVVALPQFTSTHGNIHDSFLTLSPSNTGYINSFFTSQSVYPSNADVWWRFKDATDVFNPSATAANVTLNTGAAPGGHFILNEFGQARSGAAGLTVTDTFTNMRPRTGTWFAGRIWYTGVDASKPVTGDAAPYAWAENLYFSQTVETTDDFGSCYQTNDPTAEDLFQELPTDGGIVVIQGCGKIFKLFPIQNGLLVFCQNGIWFITGSQGIGFAANDYTITKISSVQSISSTSFVNVNGLPMFWNEEGIYMISPAQQGLGLQVEPITVSTILGFYNEIPTASKLYVRGDYDPINYIVTWTYRSTLETTSTNRYNFDRALNFNTYTKAFYPYTFPGTTYRVNGVKYVSYPNAATAPDPTFKYLVSIFDATTPTFNHTFAEERDTTYKDFASVGTPVNYLSYFITGYEVTGQGQRRFQPGYCLMYSRNDEDTAYKIQSIFDYAISPDSGRWSSSQLITNSKPNYGMIMRRHVLRGHGYVLQLKVTSVDGEPFDIMGWSIWELQNTGV